MTAINKPVTVSGLVSDIGKGAARIVGFPKQIEGFHKRDLEAIVKRLHTYEPKTTDGAENKKGALKIVTEMLEGIAAAEPVATAKTKVTKEPKAPKEPKAKKENVFGYTTADRKAVIAHLVPAYQQSGNNAQPDQFLRANMDPIAGNVAMTKIINREGRHWNFFVTDFMKAGKLAGITFPEAPKPEKPAKATAEANGTAATATAEVAQPVAATEAPAAAVAEVAQS